MVHIPLDGFHPPISVHVSGQFVVTEQWEKGQMTHESFDIFVIQQMSQLDMT